MQKTPPPGYRDARWGLQNLSWNLPCHLRFTPGGGQIPSLFPGMCFVASPPSCVTSQILVLGWHGRSCYPVPMDKELILQQTRAFVQAELAGAEGGHDWWHTLRVRNMALRLAGEEKADPFVTELGALLHDIADAKFHGGDDEAGPRKAARFLRSLSVEEAVADHVEQIVRHVSFGGGKGVPTFHSSELAVVQDADRLDALGAIGIARTFNYGGHKGRALYDPDILPNLNMSKEAYRTSTGPTLNHFYEKLLLLKDRMYTAGGKRLAQQRHDFMVTFLEAFTREWSGEDQGEKIPE